VTTFHPQVVDKKKHGFDQRTSSSIIHDNICALIHKEYHPKRHHTSDIKHHVAPNIMFSVILSSPPKKKKTKKHHCPSTSPTQHGHLTNDSNIPIEKQSPWPQECTPREEVRLG